MSGKGNSRSKGREAGKGRLFTFGQDNESDSGVTLSCPRPGFSFPGAALTLTDPTSSVYEPIRDLNSDV